MQLCYDEYHVKLLQQHQLTHFGLVTPYGDRDLGGNWLRSWLFAWQHPAIVWTNVDWSSVKSSDIHMRAISQEMPQSSITKTSLKITYMKFHSNFLGANELKIQLLIQINKMHHLNDNHQTHSSKAIIDDIKGKGGAHLPIVTSQW